MWDLGLRTLTPCGGYNNFAIVESSLSIGINRSVFKYKFLLL